MLTSQVLDEALTKKNKELDKCQRALEDQKKTYEAKIKNLMGSINSLKAESNQIQNDNKDNIRVSIIKKLKQDIKDQEQVIHLIRKLHGNDPQVDEYLLKEFQKGKKLAHKSV